MNPKLFMLLLGCKPSGRHTEQHDIFFGIANNLPELKPSILNFWPEANEKIHIDAWREVNYVDNHLITPILQPQQPGNKLFFLNLGGYKPNDFEEYHYKVLTVADGQTAAIATAKRTLFFKHFDIPNGHSHIDDKYGIDVDDLYNVEDILPQGSYHLQVTPDNSGMQDELHIGYLKLSKL
ncbi:MAG TPA: DUF1543 domain-containing protein [Chitinophagaceae bacterium]|nr:DUF1543 domain-containing protein [Chitinophagaceae bacterium]